MTIGILALQGDYHLHVKLLNKFNVENILIKTPEQLLKVDGLIIPGGESTVILKLLINFKFYKSIIEFSKNKSIYGTCAGAILMSSHTDDSVETLNIINVKSYRNFWGRQIDSFTETIDLKFSKKKFTAHFIRAPKFKCLTKDLEILSCINDVPILIRNNKHLISSFHPEMTNDFTVHKYFLSMINE